MTYADDFLSDRYAQVAATIGQSYRKPASWMHEAALLLYAMNTQRIASKGRPMSDDHLKQEAVKLARSI